VRRLLAIAVAIAMVGSLAGSAAAERPHPGAELRVAAAWGTCEETTWAYPEVDLLGRLDIGRGYVALSLGYTPFDNHTFLADGRIFRAALMIGAHVRRLRIGGAITLDSVSFHADPDVLAEHPDVDQLVPRHQSVPTAGLEGGYQITPTFELGVFARVSLTELELFDSPSGDRQTAAYVLGGVYADFRLVSR